MNNQYRQHIKKQRHYFVNKGPSSQGYVFFPVVMYRCESWTIKKVEHRRINAFELWCWGRLLRVPWTARKSNQYILKEINPGCSLEGLVLKLKLQYFGHLMQRADSLEKTLIWKRLKAGGEGVDRGWDGWMASQTQWTWVWVDSGSWWWTGRPGVLWFMGLQRVRHDWATELHWKISIILMSSPSSLSSLWTWNNLNELCRWTLLSRWMRRKRKRRHPARNTGRENWTEIKHILERQRQTWKMLFQDRWESFSWGNRRVVSNETQIYVLC